MLKYIFLTLLSFTLLSACSSVEEKTQGFEDEFSLGDDGNNDNIEIGDSFDSDDDEFGEAEQEVLARTSSKLSTSQGTSRESSEFSLDAPSSSSSSSQSFEGEFDLSESMGVAQGSAEFDLSSEMGLAPSPRVAFRSGKASNHKGSLHGASAGSYTTKKGDTLMWVAFKVYGDYSKWKEIAKMNNLSSLNLSAGQVLSVGSSTFSWKPSGNPYLVLRGDTLGKISNKVYGQMRYWKNIYENNRPMIKDPNLIFAGFTLYTPVLNQVGTIEENSHQLAAY